MKYTIFAFTACIALSFSFPIDILDESVVIKNDESKSFDGQMMVKDTDSMLDVTHEVDKKVMLTEVEEKTIMDSPKFDPEMDKDDETMIDTTGKLPKSEHDTSAIKKTETKQFEVVKNGEKDVMINYDEDYEENEENHLNIKSDDIKLVKKIVDAKEFRNKCNKPFKRPKWCTTTTQSTTSTTTTTTPTTTSTTTTTTPTTTTSTTTTPTTTTSTTTTTTTTTTPAPGR